jgi:hypothetical protein
MQRLTGAGKKRMRGIYAARWKQIVIDVETGDYEIDRDRLATSRLLLAKHQDAALFGARIGYNAV